MSEDVHGQVGVRQPMKLALDLGLRGACVGGLISQAAFVRCRIERPTKAGARIEKLATGTRVPTCLSIPDVQHRDVCWKELLLVRRAARNEQCDTQQGVRLSQGPTHEILPGDD